MIRDIWDWYRWRWQECMGKAMMDDPPEILNRVAVWTTGHLILLLSVIWWGIELVVN